MRHPFRFPAADLLGLPWLGFLWYLAYTLGHLWDRKGWAMLLAVTACYLIGLVQSGLGRRREAVMGYGIATVGGLVGILGGLWVA